MPETLPEWLWFAFFTIGSAGGWVLAIVWAAEMWRRFRRKA